MRTRPIIVAESRWAVRLYSPFHSPIINLCQTVRSCVVSFTDAEGIEHSIRVPAESLYEAAVEAMAAFRRGAFGNDIWSSNTVEDSRESAGGRTCHLCGQGAVVAGMVEQEILTSR
jgi:hypothetical protein